MKKQQILKQLYLIKAHWTVLKLLKTNDAESAKFTSQSDSVLSHALKFLG